MKRNLPLIVVGATVLAVAAWTVLGGPKAKGPRSSPPAPADHGAPWAGYVAHVDPSTGRILSEAQESAAAEIDPTLMNHFSTSPEGLVEVPSPVPGGGVMIDLQGRFQNAFAAAVDDSGLVRVFCTSDPGENGDGGGGVR
jgi:hypothetical protein